MRKIIEGKHLNQSKTYDMKTGKEDKSAPKPQMFMLPAKEGTCEECAVAHEPTSPHNAQSLHYQYKFYNEHGRWPNWVDAMSHCTQEMKDRWTVELKKMGVKL